MDKKEIAEVFEEMGALLDLKGENPFRVRAYSNAARMIDGLQQDLGTLIKEDRLTEIKGVGKDLAAKITELYTTGKLKSYEELKASMPQGLLDMLRIPGFGPKRAKILFDKLTRVTGLIYETGTHLANLDHPPARDRRGARAGKGIRL